MPELRITSRSPDIEIELEEDDGTTQKRVFPRGGKKEIDWDRCKDGEGKPVANKGTTVTLELPEKP